MDSVIAKKKESLKFSLMNSDLGQSKGTVVLQRLESCMTDFLLGPLVKGTTFIFGVVNLNSC